MKIKVKVKKKEKLNYLQHEQFSYTLLNIILPFFFLLFVSLLDHFSNLLFEF